MAATAVKGIFETGDELANLEILQLDDDIHKIDRENTPFSSYLLNDKMGRKDTKAWTYLTYDIEHPPHVYKMGATEAAGDTTINIVGAANFLLAGDQLLHSVKGSMELFVVAATPSADGSVSVIRGRGGTTAQALTLGDTLVFVGGALEESQNAAPPGRQVKAVETKWALQNFRKSIQTSKPQENTAHRYGSLRKMNMKITEDWYKQGVEMAGLFGPVNTAGDQYTGPDNASPVYSSRGMYSFVTRNRRHIPEWTLAAFENALERAYQFHKAGWVYLCSPLIYRKINSIARTYMHTNEKSDRFGKVTKYLDTTWGPVEIVVEPLFVYGALKGIGFCVPAPMESWAKILQWDSDKKGSAVHWELDNTKDGAPTIYKDTLTSTFGYAFREQDRYVVTFGTER